MNLIFKVFKIFVNFGILEKILFKSSDLIFFLTYELFNFFMKNPQKNYPEG